MDLLCAPGKRLVADLGSDAEPDLGDFSYGEVIPLRIAKVIPASGSNRWKPVDISASSIRVGLGNTLTGPTSGAFSLEFDGETETLAYNFTAAQLNNALSALSTVGSAGGAAAFDMGGGVFEIRFNVAGAVPDFTAEDLDGLFPTSTAEITNVQTGDVSTKSIQSIRLVQLPAVETSTFDLSDATAATVTVIDTGAVGTDAKVSIAFDPPPNGGFWTITVTGGVTSTTEFLAYNISPAELEAALGRTDAVGVDPDSNPNVEVALDDDGVYYLHFVGNLAESDVGTVAVGAGGLKTLQYMEGTLDLRDIDAERLLANGDTELYLEVEETPSGGTPQKLVRKLVPLVSPVLTIA